MEQKSLYINHILVSTCAFVPVEAWKCPSEDVMSNLRECSAEMSSNKFCEADQALPDGNSNFEINNCGKYDIFQCMKGIYG